MSIGLRAIIFDFDGVIANSEPLHFRAWRDTLATVGVPLTAEEYYEKYLGYDDVEMIETLARDRALAYDPRRQTTLIAEKGERFLELQHGDAVLFPGAADFIRAAAAEMPIAIASGALRHEIEEILTHSRLLPHFRAIVASGETPRSKPAPDPYRRAFELLQPFAQGLEPSQCVAIEDSHWGLQAARGAGLRAVAVTSSYPADQLTAYADLIVPGLGALTLGQLRQVCDR